MGDGREIAVRSGSGLLDLTYVDEADTEELTYQIAGHRVERGVLKHKIHREIILKPLQIGPPGDSELKFYSEMYDNDDQNLTELLKAITPVFHGVSNVKSSKTDKSHSLKYLVLDDIAWDFVHPCLMDIKIGKQTWDPNASQQKINTERSKYTGTRQTLGISVPGIQYYNIGEDVPIRTTKDFVRKLNHETLYKAIQNFLNKDSSVEKTIARKILEKLEKVHQYFVVQRKYAFYASSILIAYDAKYVESTLKIGGGDSDLMTSTRDWLRLYMIDFTHVFPSNGELDTKYMFGLESLVRIFSAIVDGKCDF